VRIALLAIRPPIGSEVVRRTPSGIPGIGDGKCSDITKVLIAAKDAHALIVSTFGAR